MFDVQDVPIMQITRLTLWHVPLSSHMPYYMSDGKACGTVDTVVLRIDTDTGVSGWGEACPIPHYLPAYADGIAPAVADLAGVLLGADPTGAEAVMDRANAHLRGHPYAKSAIDIALWDLTARAAGLPVWALLGGRAATRVPVYHSITCIEPSEMARIADETCRAGVSQFQVKLGADADWQADVARLRLVREAVGPGPLIFGDWNCGISRIDAIRVGRAVADCDVMLEQPCADLDGCAAVRNATGLPMKIDEGAYDTASLLAAHRLGCMDAVALKLSKFGGLSALRRARDLCCDLGVQMCIEDTWGGDLATAAAVHLAVATPSRAVLNVCDLAGYVSPRLDPRGSMRQNGSMVPRPGPGLGIDPDPEVLGSPAAIFD